MNNKTIYWTLGIVAAGAAAYFLFFNKKAEPAPEAQGNVVPQEGLQVPSQGSTAPVTNKSLLDLIKAGGVKGTAQVGDVRANSNVTKPSEGFKPISLDNLIKSGGLV